jgi:hypothetical protein
MRKRKRSNAAREYLNYLDNLSSKLNDTSLYKLLANSEKI